ncbi:hypothetical protein Bca101_081103 [Brassica carinata]
MVQGNHQGGVSAALQQLQSRSQQTPGIETIRPGLGPQVQKAFLQNQSQFQLSPQQQQQQILAQVQGQGNLNQGNITNMYGDMDLRRFTGLPRGNLNSKDGQQNANEGSIGSPMHSSSSKHINMPPVQQASSHQQDPLLSQQSQQNNRKRKGPSSSGPANSTGTGNTVGPSNSQPSTPSTHTPVDGVAIASNMQHVNNMPKGPMMYGSDEISGLASSADQLDDMEPFGDVGALEDNVESFLSQDDGDGGSIFSTLKRNPSEHAETSKGILSPRQTYHTTSKPDIGNHDHFSFYQGLVSVRLVLLEEVLVRSSAVVSHLMGSCWLALGMIRRTYYYQIALQPGYFLRTISGHAAPVMSLDFHPQKTEILCSCDGNNDIRFWNINASNYIRASKASPCLGASTQVRFQPVSGKFLAAASDNTVSIVDVEKDIRVHLLKGHSSDVNSVCWNTSGELLASVSENSVKLWSPSSGDCIHELSSSGNKFHSCVFHPSYPNLLVIGGYQSLELWNVKENKCMTIPAHECVISALAQSPLTGMMASASHDKSVKIWK